ncbi:MAG: lipoate--protein ligase family protein [Candidatus Latescibacterota bacterium]|nr:MAG: lipoate--protein ligase family protein [Candidatus Latescibacterota bacterium]
MRNDETLQVLLQPGCSGAQNMRHDALLLESQRDMSVTLRLYTWEPPAISLGHMQRAEELLDLEACRNAGIDVVRRPTGGRAILHWEEVTYAVAAATNDRRFGASLAQSHTVIAQCLRDALARLGIASSLSRPTRDPGRRLLRQPCFASTGRAEILVEGRKLVGSAQRRTAHAFLQHGSLLLGRGHELLVDLLAHMSATERESMRARLRQETITLAELRARTPTFGEIAGALVESFSTRLEVVPDTRVGTPSQRCGRSVSALTPLPQPAPNTDPP